MPAVRRLKSRSEAYWRDEYSVSDSDIDLVTSLILEASKPQQLSELAAAIITRRLERETEAVRFQAERGAIYQPRHSYEVGQKVLFTAMDFSTAEVQAVRSGSNPKAGTFSVIRVAFEDGTERQFAADYAAEHPLNRPAEELLGGADAEVSDDELLQIFEPYVASRLEPALAANAEFVKFSGLWFLRGLLPEVHVGHLNLAEAVIYEAAKPLPAHAMLDVLEIGGAGTTDARVFALSHALAEDERFDNLGTAEDPIWYMRALEPAAVHERPAVLIPAFRAAGGEHVGITTLEMIEQVGDELDALEGASSSDTTTFQFQIPFPHLHAGTLPASPQFLSKLPQTNATHYPINLVETGSGTRMQAWVVPAERYLCGLEDWYTAVDMCVGGLITLRCTDDPALFEISAAPSRSKKSDWIRVASVDDGQLVLQLSRLTMAVRADSNMLTMVSDAPAVAQLMAQTEEAGTSLARLVQTTFQELAKLTGRGVVHAKSIYAAVNCYRRSGLVPVLAELTRRACYDPVGDGFWAYSPDLEGQTYRTPDSMRERELSTRTDLVKDQIVQYLG